MAISKTERKRNLFKGIIKSKKTSPASKTAARKNLAKLGGSKKRGNPGNPGRRKGTLKQVGQFFGLGKRLGTKAAQTRFAQTAVIAPAQSAAAGAGYAFFEAATLPIAVRLKNSRANIPVAASQVVGAWLMAISPARGMMGKAFSSVGHAGLSIEAYSMTSQLEVLKNFRAGSARLLGRVLPGQNNGGQ